MADTLAELIRYCREENTFGALLLCGEWGSGKTHLLENDLTSSLGEGYTLIRISLFGEDSVESVRRKVLLSVYGRNPGEILRPEPYINGRKLILAFDDLERTNLSQVEILGCINEYCENLHIKTIIVANEEKIEDRSPRSNSGGENGKREYLVYSEMKEKLIDRTVRLKMNDAGVVSSIIGQYRTAIDGYADFLKGSREELISLLDDCELKNIRSLRCGMQDFERIYELCLAEQVSEEEIRKYLTSFVLFTMMAKGGKITKSSMYGYGLNRLQEKYRGHYWNRCMPDCIKDGVMTGEWKEDRIREMIRKTKEFTDGTMKAENRIRTMPLMEMDDRTVSEGWTPFLELAYQGMLEPEEYVLLIRNLSDARRYGFSWPADPDMALLEQGAEQMFERICLTGQAPEPLRSRLDEDEQDRCSEDELLLYNRVTEFTDGRGYQYRVNLRQLMSALQSGDEKALFRCRRCELEKITPELVLAVLKCYRELDSNQSRISFSDLILRIFGTVDSLDEKEESRSSLKQLEKELKNLVKKKKDYPLECMALRYFIEGLQRL